MGIYRKNLVQRPFAGLADALANIDRDQDREAERLAAARLAAESVVVKVTPTAARTYGYLSAGTHAMPRRDATDHRDNVRSILASGPLSIGERNALRAMLARLDAVAA